MATAVAEPARSVEILRDLQNSMALAESRPRVELSHICKGAPESTASAMVTRLRSPPETPRMKSLPTLVLMVCEIPRSAMTTSRMCSPNCFAVMPAGGCRGARARAAKVRVSPTVKVGKWASTYVTSECKVSPA